MVEISSIQTPEPIVSEKELAAIWPQAGEEEFQALARVLHSSSWCRLGDNDWRSGECGQLERELGDYLGCDHVLVVCNGTMAIELALQALGLQPGDEVLVQAGTFFGTVTPILRLGGIPSFVDLDPLSLTLDPDSLKARCSEKTVGVIAVPLCGLSPDMDRITKFCEEHGLWLIEDCAQAIGSRWKGKALGTFGDVGTFSFQQGKALQAGEGGAVIGRDENLMSRLFTIHQGFPMPGAPPFSKHIPSTNARLTSWQAAVLRCQLARLEQLHAKRRTNYLRLCDQIKDSDAIRPVAPLAGMDFWGIFSAPLLFDSAKASGMTRDDYIAALRARGVPATPGHIEPLYWRPLYRDNPDLPCRYPVCPVTESAARESYLTIMHWFFLGSEEWIDGLVSWTRSLL